MSINYNLLPTFLIIGAGKSGTTSLNQYLSQHPEIFMCPVKEPNFFAYENKSLDDFTLPEDKYHFTNSITNLEDYLRLFKDSENYRVRGEVSNTYLYGEDSIGNIKKYIPDTKLIAVFRQPAERLYSRYLHLAREKKLPAEDIKSIFSKKSIWWTRPDLIQEGFYFKHLEHFYSNFKNNRIKVLFYDDLRDNLDNVLHDIFYFLEIDDKFKPANRDIVFNKSGVIKNKFVNKVIGGDGFIIKAIKKISPDIAKKTKQNSVIFKNLQKIRAMNLSRPIFDPEFKKRITEEIYLDDIYKLENLIGKDLKHWYTF